MRYDDDCLWVGAYLEEPQAWANITVTNSVIYEGKNAATTCGCTKHQT